jgi:MFS family permease
MTDPYIALRYPAFRFFAFTHLLFTMGILTQEIILSYYLYELTHEPLSLGLIGLAEAVPFIVLALFGGYLADHFPRKLLYGLSFAAVCVVSLFLAIYLGVDARDTRFDPMLIYTAVLFLGIARGFYNPAWSSLKPYLVPELAYSNSASWSAQFWQTGRIIGPVFGGFLYAYMGLAPSLMVVVGIFTLSVLLALQIPVYATSQKPKAAIFQSIAEGLRFVYAQPIIFYALLLDMLSVLFGGVVAILPAFAKDILFTDSKGLGILRAAPAVGSVLTLIVSAYFPPTKKAWQNMLIAVTGFGVSTLVFAVSESFTLSCVALFFTGAFDAISVVVRSTIMQIIPPEEMRGRISSVNSVFVSTSNELGAFESGLAAQYMGLVPSVLSGAGLTLFIVTWVYFKTKGLLKQDLVKA